MGEAKRKRAYSFPDAQVAEWEHDDCVNFAIAMSRITGWLLHVDWACRRKDDPLEEMKSLRVYVGDNGDKIFDVRGITTIKDFSLNTVRPLAIQRRQHLELNVYTKFYSEQKLWTVPLKVPPDETKISEAIGLIKENHTYLDLVPKRQPPLMPAHEAGEYTFGRCAAYAEALRVATGSEATALLVKRFTPLFSGSLQEGYVHSFVLHPDGTAEDSWGKQTIERIAERFGAAEYSLNSAEHVRVLTNLISNSEDRYIEVYKRAEATIKALRA